MLPSPPKVRDSLREHGLLPIGLVYGPGIAVARNAQLTPDSEVQGCPKPVLGFIAQIRGRRNKKLREVTESEQPAPGGYRDHQIFLMDTMWFLAAFSNRVDSEKWLRRVRKAGTMK